MIHYSRRHRVFHSFSNLSRKLRQKPQHGLERPYRFVNEPKCLRIKWLRTKSRCLHFSWNFRQFLPMLFSKYIFLFTDRTWSIENTHRSKDWKQHAWNPERFKHSFLSACDFILSFIWSLAWEMSNLRMISPSKFSEIEMMVALVFMWSNTVLIFIFPQLYGWINVWHSCLVLILAFPRRWNFCL